jgi:hypothetical protein
MRFRKSVRLLAAVFAINLVAASCTPDVTNPPVTQAPAPEADLIGGTIERLGGVVTGLLRCEPLPFVANQGVFGPNGGTLRLGEHALVIPRGALSSVVTIRAERPADGVASIRFYPEGLRFARPAALTMSYSNCNLVAGLLTPKRIAYTTEGLRILEYIPSVDNVLARRVTGRLDHFSRYAVSW